MTSGFSPALCADLRSLTEALDQPDVDIENLLKRLAESTRDAVNSYLGLSIMMVVEGYPVTLSTLDGTVGPANIRTSARLPLAGLCEGEPAGAITFDAGVAGAFVDFAADIGYALGLEMNGVAPDTDLPPPAGPVASRLPEVSRLNQAIGILIARGHSHEDAQRELERLARYDQVPILEAAARLILSVRTGPGPNHA